MKILLINHHPKNFGDIAMMETTINQMKEIYSDPEIIIESSNPVTSSVFFKDVKIVPRLLSISGINYTKNTFSFEFFIKNISFIFRTIHAFLASQLFVSLKLSKSSFFPILEEYKNADLVLSLAGDSITPDYAYFLRFYEIYLIKKLKRPLILYAQSIGPFKGLSLKMAKKYLSMATAIFARDATTFNLMKEYKIKCDIYRTADLVISLKPRTSDRVLKMQQEFHLDQSTVGIVIRSLKNINYSVEEYESYLIGMHQVVEEIYKKNLKPVFFASIPEDGDAAEFFKIKFGYIAPVINMLQLMPSEVKTLLSNIKLMISPRMHPIILASTVGVPVFGLGREFKMKDYLSSIGFEDYFSLIAPFNSNGVIKGIEDILINYSNLKERLFMRLSEIEELSERNSKYVKEVMNKII